MTAISVRGFRPRAHLATIALLSFIFSFIAARTFTTFYPSTVLVSGGIHVHHFWYGIALLAIGGWLGIGYENRETGRVAAILYGAGGGLIVDEVGLLLTFGNYWTGLTYTFLIILLAFVTILMLFNRYRLLIVTELGELVGNKASLYLGVFLAAASVAFITQTNNALVTGMASGLTIIGIILITTYLIRRAKIIPKRNSWSMRRIN
ncbi:MAG: hypothetical protein ABSB89_04750 [Candidatus Bathyarchaeia archaeon]